jgi:hypothetical protein
LFREIWQNQCWWIGSNFGHNFPVITLKHPCIHSIVINKNLWEISRFLFQRLCILYFSHHFPIICNKLSINPVITTHIFVARISITTPDFGYKNILMKNDPKIYVVEISAFTSLSLYLIWSKLISNCCVAWIKSGLWQWWASGSRPCVQSSFCIVMTWPLQLKFTGLI